MAAPARPAHCTEALDAPAPESIPLGATLPMLIVGCDSHVMGAICGGPA